jgi:hypothetical protein
MAVIISNNNCACHYQVRWHLSTSPSSTISSSMKSTNFEGRKKRPKPSHSGLQKEVMSLYRNLLRTCHAKDNNIVQTESSTTKSKTIPIPFIQSLTDPSSSTFNMKQKFRKQSEEVSARDHARIEHHIRNGNKYIKMMKMGNVVGMMSSNR